MSYTIREYKQRRIARMCFVEGKGRTAPAVKAAIGCHDIFNASFYGSGKNDAGVTVQTPVFHLKNEGVVLADPGWKTDGFAWDIVKPNQPLNYKMTKVADTTFDNYISGYVLLSKDQGANTPIDKNIPSRLTRRGRTLIGQKPNGNIVIYVCGDGTSDAMTAAQCKAKMIALGCTTSVMLDGGGSSQCNVDCDFNDDDITFKGTTTSIKSTRAVYNYLCVWFAPDEPPKPEMVTYYRVQVGSFGNRDNANRLMAELKAKGYSGYIQEVVINGTKMNRVQVGSFTVRANAQRLMDELSKLGYKPYIQPVELPKT